MSARSKLVIRYAFAAIAVVLLLSFVDADSVWAAISDSDHVLVLVGVLVGFVSWALNTYKWQSLLKSRGINARFVALFRLNLTGALYGTVLPGQVAGEAAKMLRLAQAPSERAQLVASVAADRMSGLLGLWIVGLVGGVISGAPITVVLLIAAGLAVTAALCLAALVGPRRTPDQFIAASSGSRISGVLHRVQRAVSVLWNALSEYRGDTRAMVSALGLSVLFQAALTYNVTLFARALDLDVTTADMAWIMAVVAVVQLLPITVAAVGTRDVAFVVMLGQIGVASAEALALSVLVLVGNLALALAGGISEFLPASDLRHGRSSAATATTDDGL